MMRLSLGEALVGGLGAMQDWPLRVTRLIDHAEREHGSAEIVSRWSGGQVARTDWSGIAATARRVARALQRLGIQSSDRVGTLAMNHAHHLACWYGVPGMGGILHTLNPRLFGDERALGNLRYTSGTTGTPKGVAYEHRSNVLRAMTQAAPDMFALSARLAV